MVLQSALRFSEGLSLLLVDSVQQIFDSNVKGGVEVTLADFCSSGICSDLVRMHICDGAHSTRKCAAIVLVRFEYLQWH